MPIKTVTKFLAGINANTRPGEIAAGIAFGFLLALQPGMTIVRIVLLAFAFMLKITMPALFFSLFVFALASPVLDVPSDLLGGFVLGLPALGGLFTMLYNMPLVPYTRFNDTLVMGGLVLGVLAWAPLFFLFRRLVTAYRNTLREKIVNSKAYKAFMKFPLIEKLVSIVGKILSFIPG
jgi:uncharacterized protein (TIGR03546 family)